MTALPRSFLYVPANRPAMFDKARRGHADAMILDLEDAVPVAERPPARIAAADWLRQRNHDTPDQSPRCWVRISDEISADLNSVVGPSLDGVFLAKCTSLSLAQVTEQLSLLEQERGLPAGSVSVIGLVESADTLLHLPSMTSNPRLTTFGIGEVDLLSDLRMSREHGAGAALDALRIQVVVQCAAAGLHPPVAPTSTDFRDLDAFHASTKHLVALGFRSRTAIHPCQVPIIHQALTPSGADLQKATEVVRCHDAASGGVTTDASGRLVDQAVVREAREILARGGLH